MSTASCQTVLQSADGASVTAARTKSPKEASTSKLSSDEEGYVILGITEGLEKPLDEWTDVGVPRVFTSTSDQTNEYVMLDSPKGWNIA